MLLAMAILFCDRIVNKRSSTFQATALDSSWSRFYWTNLNILPRFELGRTVRNRSRKCLRRRVRNLTCLGGTIRTVIARIWLNKCLIFATNTKRGKPFVTVDTLQGCFFNWPFFSCDQVRLWCLAAKPTSLTMLPKLKLAESLCQLT